MHSTVMGSQKQVCGFILTWFLIIWCVCEAKVSLSSTNDNEEDKVNLSLYYESLCPYCASFIVNELVKVFKTDLISIVNLRLVPWGNTQISPNNTWICQVHIILSLLSLNTSPSSIFHIK